MEFVAAGNKKVTRRASIEIDLAPSAAPPIAWTAEWVRQRLVEAYQIERRLPGVVQYFIGNGWPETTDTFAEKVYQGELAREAVLDKWERGGGCTTAEVTRKDQAQDWLLNYLATYHIERTCLMHWATATAYHRPLRPMLRRRRWSTTTFYKRVEDGAKIIARELQRDGVPVS